MKNNGFFSDQNLYELYLIHPDKVRCSYLYESLRAEIEKRFEKSELSRIYKVEQVKYIQEVRAYTLPDQLKESMIESAQRNENQVPIMRAKDIIVKMLFAQVKEKNEDIENFT